MPALFSLLGIFTTVGASLYQPPFEEVPLVLENGTGSVHIALAVQSSGKVSFAQSGSVYNSPFMSIQLRTDLGEVHVYDETDSDEALAVVPAAHVRSHAMLYLSVEMEVGETVATMTQLRFTTDSFHNEWTTVENASFPGSPYTEVPASVSAYVTTLAPFDKFIVHAAASSEEEVEAYYTERAGGSSGLCDITEAQGVWKAFLLPEPITPDNPTFQYTMQVITAGDVMGSDCVLVLSDEPIYEVPIVSVGDEADPKLEGEYVDIASRFRFSPEVGYNVEHCCCETPGACVSNDTAFSAGAGRTPWLGGEPIPFHIAVDFDEGTYAVTTGSGAGPVAVATDFVWMAPVTNASQLRYARFAQLGSGAQCRICPYTGDVATLTEGPTTTASSTTSGSTTSSTSGMATTTAPSTTRTTKGDEANQSMPAEGGVNLEAEVSGSAKVALTVGSLVGGVMATSAAL